MATGMGLESLIPKGGGGGVSTPVITPREERERAPVSSPRPSSQQGETVSSVKELKTAKSEITKEAVFHIEVQSIIPNPYQPRRDFNEEELKELAQSIREFGIIQPLVVSKTEEETESGTRIIYQIIAGERRWRAAKMIGLERVPAIVRRADSKKEHLELAVIENIQRSGLNPLETARAYARLQDEFGLTQREVASRLGKSREAVANTLRLLSAPSYIQEAVQEGAVSESQARILLSVSSPAEQRRLFDRIVHDKITVRQLKEVAKSGVIDPERTYLEKKLEEKVGAPVVISRKGERGKVMIRFFSEEELRGVIERLLGAEGI